MQGKLIVIDGLDGSGKATQAKLLYEEMKRDNENVMKISFPDYDSESSALIKMYLRGDFGSEPDSVNPYAASSFYAADRFASYMTKWRGFYLGGGTVIADRYTTSNAIHQCAKLPEEKWADFLEWLMNYEYGLIGIPAPSRTISLRADTEVSQRLMSGRYNGDEQKKDIHESNIGYLRKARRAADYCASVLGWDIVECVRDGEMRLPEDILDEIKSIVT